MVALTSLSSLKSDTPRLGALHMMVGSSGSPYATQVKESLPPCVCTGGLGSTTMMPGSS